MRYIIHGAGAIGGLIGGRLAAGGAQVLLIARQAMADAVAQINQINHWPPQS